MKNRLSGVLLKFAGVCTLVLTLGSVAQATAILKLTSSGGGLAVIVDNGVGDGDSTVGVIKFTGGLGTGTNRWLADLTIGSTYPALGSFTQPWMDIASVNVSNSSQGTMVIEFTQEFDVNAPVLMRGAYKGNSGGIVKYNLFAGTAAFAATQNVFGGTVATGVGPFSGQFFNGLLNPTTLPGWTPVNNVWLTQRININHTKKEKTQGTFDAQVPEPTTLLLLGAGLAGLGLLKRKQQ